MSLQRRLTIFFVVIVIIPLTVAGFVVQRIVAGEISKRTELSLPEALSSVVTTFEDRAEMLDERLNSTFDPDALAPLAGDSAKLDEFLQDRLMTDEVLDFVYYVTSDGSIRGSAEHAPSFLHGVERPPPQEIASSEGTGDAYATASVPVTGSGGRAGSLVGGFWLDDEILHGADQKGVGLSIVVNGRVIASTLPLDSPKKVGVEFPGTFRADIGDEVIARARELESGVSVMATIPATRASSASTSVLKSILILLILALIGTAALAILLARLITRPLDEVSVAAQAVSEGRFDQRIPVRSRDEVGRLAVAFNDMTDRLASTIGELKSSRDMLQRAVRRVGETLRSTHEMPQLLESLLNTGADAVGADSAILWMFTRTRGELYPAMARGAVLSQLGHVKVGEGVVGVVAERGTNVVLSARDGGPIPSRNEPRSSTLIAVPLYSHQRIMGVLVTYKEAAERPFHAEDVETLAFLAEQGGVAVENVLLHEEAQRLSLTDGLTGIYNRRYLQMHSRQVLAAAVRFNRPFSILMMDLDHFKQVNDTYGHNRGDAILIEFSKRVSAALREVDTFARYGGEEFVCLLSETAVDGAMTTAEKILEAVRSAPFGEPRDPPVTLTVSIGIASYPVHGETFRSLIESADRALYGAKKEGRDRARTPGDALQSLEPAT